MSSDSQSIRLAAFLGLVVMSGFEVAGVVLGALPILIEGLKAVNKAESYYDLYKIGPDISTP